MHNITHLHPKFSIITVTYNAENVLEDTIQSVITQTYKNVEYIIVDGKSTDKTMEIVGRYKEHIHTVVSERDKGLYDAMNKGIALATGDYVCFLNAGDELHEDDTLQLMVHSLAGLNELPDVIYGETAIVDEEGHFLRMRDFLLLNNLHGKVSVKVCWSVIKLSLPVVTAQSNTICTIVSLPTSTGASVS